MSFHHPSPTSSSPNTTTLLKDHEAAIIALPHDIINTHILNKLDGPTLASISCTSTQLYYLCLNQDLWHKICNDKWPSTRDPRVHYAISALPFGYRSIFSNSASSFQLSKKFTHSDYDCHLSIAMKDKLVSAVDMHYKGRPVYSKVKVTSLINEETLSGPAWVEMVKPEDDFPNETQGCAMTDSKLVSRLARKLRLSWIMINPARELAANSLDLTPVFVEPHCSDGHVYLHYSTLLSTSDSLSNLSETVEMKISVLCEVKKGGEVRVGEMNLEVLDMYSENMKWRDSLVILQKTNKCESRLNGKGREKFEEHLKRVEDRKREINKIDYWRLKIESIVTLLFLPVFLLCWGFWFLFRSYILRRRDM